jgi:flagellar hook-associated protein 3 FlgL
MDLSFYSNFSSSLAAQEAQLNVLQQQISTGLTVQTPDQNPAAYETAALGTDQVARLANDNTTQASIQVQLGSANDAYSSMSALLNNVQGIVEQALNGTTSSANMNALSGQVQSAAQQLLALGNTTAPNGTFLFGGSRGGLAPFQEDSSGNIAYFGDGASSQANIGEASTAGTIANGTVFVSALQGDGIGAITAASSNSGTGQIIPEGTVNAAAANSFQQGNSPITVTFGAGNSYTATQGGSTIASGTLSTAAGSSGTSVQLAGVDYNLTGTPASGDSFTIAPARTQSAFTLLKNISTALANAGTTPAQVAQTNQLLNQGLAGIAQYQQSVATVQAQNGVTLEAISATAAGNTNQSTEAQTTVNNATAVNTPVAIAALDQTMTALQAAMKTFGTVQNLSLFNYL